MRVDQAQRVLSKALAALESEGGISNALFALDHCVSVYEDWGRGSRTVRDAALADDCFLAARVLRWLAEET